MKIMYEVNWYSIDDVFTHCSISKIRVTRQEGSNISAIDSEGRTFLGDEENYFNTEEEAVENIKISLTDTLYDLNKTIEEAQANMNNINKYLETLK